MAAERRDGAAFRHVVVATDFTPGATAAFQRALTLPIAGHGLIELVHVLPMDLPRKTRTTIRTEAAARLEAATEVARTAANRAHCAR